MRGFDYSPFYRATVGFDRVFDLLDNVAGQTAGNGYPPYNIEKAGDNAYRIVMAVAGFAEAELSLTQKENELLVTGQTRAERRRSDKQYLYRGIAGRNFERRFQLADHVKVAVRSSPTACSRSSCSARSRKRRRPVRSRSRPRPRKPALTH